MRVNNLTLTSDRRGGAVWKWYSFSDQNLAEEYLNGPKRFLNFPDFLQIILSERLALHLQIVVRMSIPHDLEKHPTVHPNTVLEPRFGLLIILPNCSKLCHDNICPASVTNIILYTWLSRETNPVIDPRLGGVWWAELSAAWSVRTSVFRGRDQRAFSSFKTSRPSWQAAGIGGNAILSRAL